MRRLIRDLVVGRNAEALAERTAVVLTDTDLGDLLTQLGDALTGRINVPVKMTIMGEDFFSGEIRVIFYRLCQEALNNIAKHAHPSRVEISLICKEGTIEIKISGNGRGLNPTIPLATMA